MFSYLFKKISPYIQNNQQDQNTAQLSAENKDQALILVTDQNCFQIAKQLERAVEESNYQVVKDLCNNYAKEIRTLCFDPASHWLLEQIAYTAVNKGHFESVELVFNCFGQEISAACKGVALHNAISRSDRITKLLFHRYNHEISVEHKVLAVETGVSSGHYPRVEPLLNGLNKSEAYRIASNNGHQQTIELLLTRFSQDISIADKNLGLERAMANSHFRLVNYLLKIPEIQDEFNKRPELMHSLVNSFVDFNTDTGSALANAIDLGYDQLSELVLRYFEKNELLRNASKNGAEQAVELLFNRYSHEIDDGTKNIVLQNACQGGDYNIVKSLLSRFNYEISKSNKKLALQNAKNNTITSSGIIQLLLMDFCEKKNLSEKRIMLRYAITNYYFDLVNYLLEMQDVMDEFIKVPQQIHDLLTMFSYTKLTPQREKYIEKILKNSEIRFYLIENEAIFVCLKKFQDNAQTNASRRVKNSRAITPRISEPPKDDLSLESSRKKLRY